MPGPFAEAPVHRLETPGIGTPDISKQIPGVGVWKLGVFNRQPALNRFPHKA